MIDIARCPACDKTQIARVTQALCPGSDLVGCRVCGTEFLSPQPSDEQLNAIYSDAYYEPWSHETASVVRSMKRGTFEPILAAAGLRSGDRLLDLGCARGELLELASDSGARTYGVDLNSSAIAKGRSQVPGADFHEGTLDDNPFPGVSFDVISMVDFLEHVRDPAAALTGARARLAEHGRIVISTPRRDSNVRRVTFKHWPQYRHEHLTYLTSTGMREVARRGGLSVQSLRATWKTVTPSYLLGQAIAYPTPVLSPVIRAVWRAVPFKHRMVRLPFGEMTVVLTRRP